ncbi:hypothetical protein [Glutamicibacter sp. NPDC087344]|uniref:hypothetical protein n=1 Tax=Glutamicibacter sp. NPDC087344 TaxID=3363994 RepID=UPI0038247354
MARQRSKWAEDSTPNDAPAEDLHVEQRGRNEYVIVDSAGNVHSKVLTYLAMFAARQHAKNAVAFSPTITLSPNMKALIKYQIPGE